MAVITPVGKFDFDWSPKDSAEMVKTASTEAKEQKTDKDALYEAAKIAVAQFSKSEETSKEETSAGASKDEVSKGETSGTSAGTSADTSKDIGVSKAVEVLMEKVEKSKDIVEKVDAAMGKVEQAVEEVKAAVGETSGAVADAVIAPEVGAAPEIPVDKAPEVPEVAEFEVELEGDKPEVGGEDIIQTSLGDSCGACAASIKGDLKKEAAADDMVKTSKLSPSTRTKLMTFWKEKLKYDPEYCKIWFADNK